MSKIISFNFDHTKKNEKKKNINTHTNTVKKRNTNNRQTLLKYIHNFQDKNHIVNDTKKNDSAFTSSVNYMNELSNKIQECANTIQSPHPILLTPCNVDKPQHGCLKNGSLPTYREYQKQLLAPPPLPFPASLPVPVDANTNANANANANANVNANANANVNVNVNVNANANVNTDTNANANVNANANANTDINITQEENQEKIKKTDELEKKNQVISTMLVKPINETQEVGGINKRTVKRTYHVGKCKSKRKISVLISNKSKQTEISNKNLLVKRTPLHTVKRFLVKRGLIKVGCIAPPNVLRKMYESVELMCGNVTNHNTDTLLHNYMNE
jgi:CTP-dependent riboflavin kinase